MDDRRKIFGIGLSRTGTTSLTQALLMLNIRSLHWPHDAATQRELMPYLADRRRPFAFSAAEFYQGLTDTPVVAVYRELAQRYPDARFILTGREREAWLHSCERAWETSVALQYAGELGPYCRAINTAVYGRPDFCRETFAQVYERHRAEVLTVLPGVLELEVGEGWDRLCAFLNQSVPARPYPHVNQGFFRAS
jgi:hypothetical protein